MKHTAEEICEKLNINIEDVWNIYPYGSRIYGNSNKKSDYDYIIVYKKSLLPSGAFKDNAKSSADRTIQGTCYSRGGFIDAINNYQMPALEAIFLPKRKIVKKTFDFKLVKVERKELAKKVITLASASWHSAILSIEDDNYDNACKNTYHALRILLFGIQVKENGAITDYKVANDIKKIIYSDPTFTVKKWTNTFNELSAKLKSENI